MVVKVYSNGEWKELSKNESERVVYAVRHGDKKPYIDCFHYATPGYALEVYYVVSAYTPTKEETKTHEGARYFKYYWLININNKYYVLTATRSKSRVCIAPYAYLEFDEPVPVEIVKMKRIPKYLVKSFM